MENIIRIRGVTEGKPTRQMETSMKVNGKKKKAIIDSGADINYANEKWCSQNEINCRITGYGKIKAYDGSYVQEQRQ